MCYRLLTQAYDGSHSACTAAVWVSEDACMQVSLSIGLLFVWACNQIEIGCLLVASALLTMLLMLYCWLAQLVCTAARAAMTRPTAMAVRAAPARCVGLLTVLCVLWHIPWQVPEACCRPSMEGSTCYNCAAQAHAGAHFDCSVLLTVCFLRRSQDEDVWVQRSAIGCTACRWLHWPAGCCAEHSVALAGPKCNLSYFSSI